jgi:hypothetical protein
MMAKEALSKEAWLEHLSRQKRSKDTQKEYCRKHGLSLSAFRYWNKRRAREATFEEASFIELPITEPKSVSIGDICTIEFPNGCSLRVHTTSRMPELAKLATMVSGL